MTLPEREVVVRRCKIENQKTCPTCSKKYNVAPCHRIRAALKGHVARAYCSLECQKRANRFYFKCLWCGEDSWKYKRDFERGEKAVCSLQCSFAYRKKK